VSDEARIDRRLRRLERRRSAAVLELGAPGPDADLLRRLIAIALRVPDHGRLEPWRLIVLEGKAKSVAGERLAEAYVSQNPDEDPDRRDKQAAKIVAHFAAAPVAIVVVSCADPQAKKPEWEQVLSAGAVCMNLLTASALAGFGGVWLTGWAAYDEAAKRILGLAAGEKIAGFIHIGTEREKLQDRPRPDPAEKVTFWQAQ
jgi:nitroreductase